MRKLKLLMSKSVLLMILVSCNASIPPAPDGDLCGAIDTGNLDTDYAYCRGRVDRDRKYRIPAREVFKRRMIMITPQYYGELKIWEKEVKKAVDRHCN